MMHASLTRLERMVFRVSSDDESTLFLDAFEFSRSCIIRRTSPKTHGNGVFPSGRAASFFPATTADKDNSRRSQSSSSDGIRLQPRQRLWRRNDCKKGGVRTWSE